MGDPYAAARAMTRALEDAAGQARATLDGRALLDGGQLTRSARSLLNRPRQDERGS